MNILITGGAGYIGAALAEAMCIDKQVEKIVLYDNLSAGRTGIFYHHRFGNKKITFTRGELLDSRKLKSALKDIDIVYHLAALAGTDSKDGHFTEQVNHWGTAVLADCLEDTSVKKVVYLSTTSVYGPTKEPVDVTYEPLCTAAYAVSKWRGESQILRLKDQADTYVLRCGNVYGFSTSQRFDQVVNRFLFDAQFSGRISVHGNGRQYRSFIHINKVINCLSGVSLSTLLPGIYNLSEHNLQVLDIVETLQELYPSLEFIFVNPHLDISGTRAKPSPEIINLAGLGKRTLKEELEDFKALMAF